MATIVVIVVRKNVPLFQLHHDGAILTPRFILGASKRSRGDPKTGFSTPLGHPFPSQIVRGTWVKGVHFKKVPLLFSVHDFLLGTCLLTSHAILLEFQKVIDT